MQIVELAAKLQSVGFTDKQAKVYVAALFLGPSAVQKISEQAEINRATAYVILDELAQMGLVSESTQGKKTVFVAEPPEAIDRYLDSQVKFLDAKKNELKDLLPSLNETSRSTDVDVAPQVRFYKGREGILQTNADKFRKIKPDSTIYGMSNTDEVEKMFPGHFVENPNRRLKKKVASKAFYYYSDENEVKSNKNLMRQIKRIDKPITADFTFYPTSAALITYNGENSVGIVIENKQIAETLRTLFEMAWEKDSKKS